MPPVPPVLRFIQQHAGLDDREAYGTLNMGAGFALFVRADEAQATVDVARAEGCGVPPGWRDRSKPAPSSCRSSRWACASPRDELQLR